MATPSFTISARGFSEARAALRRYPVESRREFKKAISRSVRAVNAETKRRSPVDTGRMRASVHVSKEEATEGRVDVGVNYAVFVHEGTRYMRGRPFMENAVKHLKRFIEKEFTSAMARIFRT